MFDTLVNKLKERLTHFRLGDSLDKTIDMGAIVDESQKKSIEEYVEDARREGAEVRGHNVHLLGLFLLCNFV